MYDDKDESTARGLYPVCIHGNDCGKYPREKIYTLGILKLNMKGIKIMEKIIIVRNYLK